MLADSFGRVATDLRISLTDRCNLRCTYCMPAEGLDWLPRAELLTDDEIIRLARIAVARLGVTEVRLTGGEPLLRPGLPGLVAQLAALRPRPDISLTTNGIALARLAEPLREAGLDRQQAGHSHPGSCLSPARTSSEVAPAQDSATRAGEDQRRLVVADESA